MSDTQLATVLIGVYQGEKYLAEAIESALAQSYAPLEFIVVNDGSTDGTAEVAARYSDKIRIFEQPNGGLASALNRGISEARGEYYSILDADDIWQQEKIEKQISALMREPAF